MFDLIYLGLILGFFLIALAYIEACDRLKKKEGER